MQNTKIPDLAGQPEIGKLTDHQSVKDNSNTNVFPSETDLLNKAFLIVDLLRSAASNPARFTSEYGIYINNRFKKITLTADEIINSCKSWDVEISQKQIEFIFRLETNRHLFAIHTYHIGSIKTTSYSYL